MVLVGMDSPNGEKVILTWGDSNKFGTNLLYYVSDEMFSIVGDIQDDYRELKEGNRIQVTLVDFDYDGKQEVVLAIGDGLVNLGVSVFKIDYHSKDLDAIEIGCFQGQENIHIDKNNDIIIPFGGQGLFEQYKYNNGKFIKIK